VIRLIVGLGNPGKEYIGTRHNFGRAVVEAFAVDKGVSWRTWRGQSVAKVDSQLSLLLPETYMNRSGEAVGQFVHYFALKPDQVLVVADELDLPLGELELRRGGYHAGHRGHESVAEHLSTADYWRLRLGIGRPVGNRNPDTVAEYVLGQFRADEQVVVAKIIDESVSLLVESQKIDPVVHTWTVPQAKE